MDKLSLNNIERSLEKIANNLHKPFDGIDAKSRHRELISIQDKQTELQKKQLEILDKQTNLVLRQTEFSRLLTLATIVLAIGAFLQTTIQIMNIPSETYSQMIQSGGIWITLLAIMGLLFFISLMGGIVYLIIMTLFKKKKTNQ